MNQKVSAQLESAAGSFDAELYARHGVYFSCVPLIRLVGVVVGGRRGVREAAENSESSRERAKVWSSLRGGKRKQNRIFTFWTPVTNDMEKKALDLDPEAKEELSDHTL